MTDELLDADEALANALGAVVSDFRKECRQQLDIIVSESRATIAELKGQIAVLQAQLRERSYEELARVPAALALIKDGAPGIDGKSVDPAEIKQMVAQAVTDIPRPRDGIDGTNGTSIDPDEVRALIAVEVGKAIGVLPKPQDGRTPTEDEITVIVERAISAIPKPRDGIDGKNIDLIEVQQMIGAAVESAVTALPPASPGKDADMDAVFAAVKGEVERSVGAIPRPVDGRTPTDEDLAPLVEKAVARAAAAIPVPKDGIGLTDGFIDHEGALVLTLSDGSVRTRGRVKGLDGRTPTTEDIRPIVCAEVKAAVALMPPPERGPAPDPAELADLIRSEVEKAISRLPPPKDGVNGESVDPAAIERIVEDAIKKIPVPKDGIDGKSIDASEVVRMVSDAVSQLPPAQNGVDGKDANPDLVKALVIKEVDERVGSLARPQDGRDGKDADPALMKALVIKEVDERVGAISRPQDGRDGKDADWDAIERRIDWSAKAAVSELPKPRDGIDGKTVTAEDIASLVEAEVVKRFSSEPAPLSVIEIEELAKAAAEIVLDLSLPALAKKAAELVPPVDPPQLPDIVGAIHAAVAELPSPQPGPIGPPGKVDEQELTGLIEIKTLDHLRVPSHMVSLVQRAGDLLSQPFAFAVDNSGLSPIGPRRKTIRIGPRGKDGSLSAEVIEQAESENGEL